jgi:hypothetical protein
LETTPTKEALALMGRYALVHDDVPEVVTFSESELVNAASEKRFLFHVPKGSILSMMHSRSGKMSARVPVPYKRLPVILSRHRSEWVLAKFSHENGGGLLAARHLVHLCVEWNNHDFLKPYYRRDIKTTTVLKEGGFPVVINPRYKDMFLHCRDVKNVLYLVGEARPAVS